MPSRRPFVLLLGLVAAVLAACAGPPAHRASPATPTPPVSGAASPCGARTTPPDRYDHVVWIWLENHTSGQVFDHAPYLDTLRRQCGSITRYASVGSPSLPNYLAATSGSTTGVSQDVPPAQHPVDRDNLFRQVRAAGGTATSFVEDMPVPCELADRGRYAVRHNPATYYIGNDDRAACTRDDVPLGTPAAGALVDAIDARLPTFSFVVPNLCDDMHDCAVATGDQWLRQVVGRILASSAYAAGRTAVFIVWDEPTPMPFLVVAPTAVTPSGSVPTADHYSLLRTTEELLGINDHIGAAATAPSLRTAFGI